MPRTAPIVLIAALLASPLPARTAVAERDPSTRVAVVRMADLPQGTDAPWTPPAPMPVRGDLPVPQDAVPGDPAPEPGPQPLADPPAPTAGFEATPDDNTRIPPDTMGAAGPDHLVVTLNSSVRIQTKTGTVLSTVGLTTFFSSVTGGARAFDPRVFYDRLWGRWIIVAAAAPRLSASGIVLAVSATGDPTGTWTLLHRDTDGSDGTWADYPTLGYNKDWVVVQVNLFSLPGDSFVRSDVFVYTKTSLASGSPSSLTHSISSGTQVPAVTFDASLGSVYLLQTWNTNSSGSGYLRLYSVSGAAGGTLTDHGLVSVASTWAFSPSTREFAPQSGSSRKIDPGDSRMHGVVYRNGSLWATQTVFLPASSPTRSSIQWWEIAVPSRAVAQFGRVDDPSAVFHAAYPGIAVNKHEDVVLGYTRFSAGTFASAAYTMRRGTDPASTMRTPALFKAGEAKYVKTFSATVNRWGDYSASSVDPRNDSDMWTIQEYAGSPSGGADRWGTWWARIPGVPGVKLAQTGGSTAVTEGGADDTYTVVLDTAPSAGVTITPSPGSQVTVSPTSLTFTTTNWFTPKTVTVAAVDDAVAEPTPQAATVTHTATSADPNYSGIAVASVPVSVTDNDSITVVVAETDGTTEVSESSGADTYTLRLASAPAGPVTVTVAPDDQLTSMPGSVTFTASDWSAPRTITVAAVDDDVDEPTPHTGTIVQTASTPNATVPDVDVAIVDDDPEVEGEARLANPGGRTLSVTEALLLVFCGIPPAQGIDGMAFDIAGHDPFATVTPGTPDQVYEVVFYDASCARAGRLTETSGPIPASARWAVVNYVSGDGPGTFTFRY